MNRVQIEDTIITINPGKVLIRSFIKSKHSTGKFDKLSNVYEAVIVAIGAEVKRYDKSFPVKVGNTVLFNGNFYSSFTIGAYSYRVCHPNDVLAIIE